MAESGESATSHNPEKTFRAYTNDEGAKYARYRYGYHPNLFKRIVDYHTSTGGKLDTVVDLGCGPGTATLPIASFFQNAIGLDPSDGMIAAAKDAGGNSASGQPVRYGVSRAEDIKLGSEADTGFAIADGGVDLITAATAAHWFDMSKFWPRANQVLRPGGSVAIWCGNFGEVHPSVPYGEEMNKALKEIEDRELLPFFEPGNILVRDLYTDIGLPWTTDSSADFDQATFYRKEWGTPGNDDAEAEGSEFFMNGQLQVDLDRVEKTLATASPVARWRQKYPDKVGTSQDVTKIMRTVIEDYLHKAGVPRGKELIKGRVTGVLLIVKKRA